MSLIREEVVERILNDNTHPMQASLSQEIRYAMENARATNPVAEALMRGVPVSREAVVTIMETIKTFCKRTGHMPSHKGLRPYNYDDLSNLKREQAWWGFEFECGFSSEQARADAIEYAWEVADGVTFDGEGEGSYLSEVTFLPAEESKFDDGTAPAYRFMQWCSDHPDAMHKTHYESVGTHLNLSHPKMTTNLSYIAGALNNSIHHLPWEMEGKNVRQEMLGRSNIYAGCFQRQAASGRGTWIECKLFRTTYTMEQFQNYIRTAKALSRCIDALTADGVNLQNRGTYIANLYEVWKEGAEPIVSYEATYNGSGNSEYISRPVRNPTQPAVQRVVRMTEDEDDFDPFLDDDE